ncbi:hypothetical protein Tco_0136430, partial [Tanacetum coccineum]
RHRRKTNNPALDDDDDDQQGDDKRTESDNDKNIDLNKTDDEEETQEGEFVHTPDDNVPTDDETLSSGVLTDHQVNSCKHTIPAAVVTDVLKQQQQPQKSFADICKIKMEQTGKQQETKYTITSSYKASLKEFDQKRTLFKTMTKSKSFNKNPKHIALYHALMESILENEDDMDKGVADKLKKRKPDDANRDEDPPARPDQGLKR